jgi:hypothetical protein
MTRGFGHPCAPVWSQTCSSINQSISMSNHALRPPSDAPGSVRIHQLRSYWKPECITDLKIVPVRRASDVHPNARAYNITSALIHLHLARELRAAIDLVLPLLQAAHSPQDLRLEEAVGGWGVGTMKDDAMMGPWLHPLDQCTDGVRVAFWDRVMQDPAFSETTTTFYTPSPLARDIPGAPSGWAPGSRGVGDMRGGWEA